MTKLGYLCFETDNIIHMNSITFLSRARMLLLCFALGIMVVPSTGCKTKEGCGLEEKYAPKTDRDGNLSRKRGKSNLFSKKQRRKMRAKY